MNRLLWINSNQENETDHNFTPFFPKGLNSPESRCNFRAFARMAPYAILVVSRDIQISYANHQTCKLLGYTMKELAVIDVERIFYHDVMSCFKQLMEKMSNNQNVAIRLDTKLLMKNGMNVPVNFCASTTMWDNKPSVAVISGLKTTRPSPEDDARQVTLEESLKRQLVEREREIKKQRQVHHTISSQLLETNRAIAALARNNEKNKEEIGKTISRIIDGKILPIITELKRSENSSEVRLNLDIFENYLTSLSAGLSNNDENLDLFSCSEMKVATMIKNGATSQEIADQLYISPHTVKTHRKHIRRKLNIQNAEIDLADFLSSAWTKT